MLSSSYLTDSFCLRLMFSFKLYNRFLFYFFICKFRNSMTFLSFKIENVRKYMGTFECVIKGVTDVRFYL